MKAKITTRLVDSLKPAEKPYEVCDTELRGFILRVQPSGYMSYLCDYRLQGVKADRMVLGPVTLFTPAQARDWAEETLQKVRKGIDPKIEKRLAQIEARAYTLRSYIEQEYQSWAETHLRSGKTIVARIKSCFDELLDKPLNDASLSWLVDKWRTKRVKGGIKKATVDREVSALRAVFSHAIKSGQLTDHPLVKLKALQRSGQDDEGDHRIRYLGQFDPEEERRFWDAIDAREARIREGRRNANLWRKERSYELYPDLDVLPYADDLKPIIEVALNTGLRRKEIFLLEMSNLNLDSEQPMLTVPGRIAKSKKTRHIPLNRRAANALRQWLSQRNSSSNLVFPGENGKPKDNMRKVWEKLMTDAKLKDFRFHDMRHDFASKLVMRGEDLNTVRELLGHADLSTTLRYSHLQPKKLANAVARLDEVTPVELVSNSTRNVEGAAALA